MSFANTITLLFNGVTIALALGFLLIVLWQDARKETNQLFAALLFLVTLWNIGSLITLALSLVDAQSSFLSVALSVMELGFTGSSIAIYALTAVLVGVHTKRFRGLAFLSLVLVLGYQIFLIVTGTTLPFESLGDGFYKYRFQPLSAIFYLTFDSTAFYLTWRYRRKIKSLSLITGINLFVLGQSLGFLNPELGIVSLSINLSSFATLVISFALLRQEIIIPLAERITQVEAVHKVTLAITSQLAIDTVLNQIAIQAVDWLNADGAGIFLNRGDYLDLATVHNLPKSYLHQQVLLGEGVAGTVAKTRQSIHLENYGRDWKQKIDLPLADETFGSVISIPLLYGSNAIGVLMVIAGRQGRLFRREDVGLLELLGSQAAVAIAHSQLFADQQKLTKQVEAARSQLETVLISTENPVIAIDRKFQLIFANPAFNTLIPIEKDQEKFKLPARILPTNFREALRELHQKRTFTYEISEDKKFYLCHVAQLGKTKTQGWVAILNDITQLKELDRLKSEMIRMTSHDLKNPLQAAMANLELLTDDLKTNTDKEINKSLDIINKQLLRMNRIISGILDLERAKIGISNTDLYQPELLSNRVIDDLEPLAKDQGITLETKIAENLPEFWGDGEQIERALSNLIENAIKFTPSGGKVSVEIQQKKDNILFEIRDTGIGIPEHLQSQIFERFLRGSQHGQKGAEHISGSGLGLSLVKTIIENHQGEIWLKSKINEGTTFYISIPITSNVAKANNKNYRKTTET
jgi:two-component system, OmpR family, phosphate regulon sensor histidine kinase PhoR